MATQSPVMIDVDTSDLRVSSKKQLRAKLQKKFESWSPRLSTNTSFAEKIDAALPSQMRAAVERIGGAVAKECRCATAILAIHRISFPFHGRNWAPGAVIIVGAVSPGATAAQTQVQTVNR